MENPYQPPRDPTIGPRDFSGQGASDPRPTVVTVFGILNIVFGSFGLLCTPFGLLSLYLPQPAGAPPNPVFDLMKDPTYRTILLVFMVIGVIAGGVLLAAGIGLMRLKPWGRTLSIGYGCYAIVSVVLGVIYNYFYLWKPMLAAAGQANNPQAIGGTMGVYAGIASSFLGLIYPTLLIIFMTRPRVVEAFRRKPEAGPDWAPLERV
jgi:hypothetical protein